jgi:hypothetical protein
MHTGMSRPFIGAALLFLAWIVPGLFGHDPWKPDEAYSFGLVYELLQGGSWVVPTLAGEPFMEKPPVFYLTSAAFADALRRNLDRAAYGWTARVTAAWSVAACFFLRWMDAGKTYRPVVSAIASRVPPEARCVASADLGEPQRTMLHYFGGIRTRRIEADVRARPRGPVRSLPEDTLKVSARSRRRSGKEQHRSPYDRAARLATQRCRAPGIRARMLLSPR